MQIVIQGKQDNSFTATKKAIEQISQQIVSLAIEQVRVKLQTKASRFHISVNSFKSAFTQSSVLKLKDSIHFNFLILVYRVYNKIIIYFIVMGFQNELKTLPMC
jgi:uncharacterized membrane protein